MDPVRLYIEKAIENGDFSERDIGWFRANLEINIDDVSEYDSSSF